MIPALENSSDKSFLMAADHTFEECLADWRMRLARKFGSIGSIRWVLRENLSVSDAKEGERDPSVSLHFQCLAPALSQSDIARVFDRERTAGRPVHFELVAAQPEALLMTLRREPTWTPFIDAGDGWTMQLEPSFHSFVEVKDLDTWRQLTAGRARSGARDVLDGVQSFDASAGNSDPASIPR